MFNKIFQRKYTIERHFNAPLLQERLKFLNYCFDNGVAIKTLQRIAQYLLVIIDYLNLEYKEVITIAEVERGANKWSNQFYRYANAKHYKSKNANSCFIVYATQWLGMLGRIHYPSKNISLFSNQLQQYINYLRHEKGLSEETIKSRFSQLNNLFLQISNKPFLHKINLKTIDNILLRKSKNNCSIASDSHCSNAE